jgi:hypothetical protein
VRLDFERKETRGGWKFHNQKNPPKRLMQENHQLLISKYTLNLKMDHLKKAVFCEGRPQHVISLLLLQENHFRCAVSSPQLLRLTDFVAFS